MSPTIALKCRLDRTMKQESVVPRWNLSKELRRISIGSAIDLAPQGSDLKSTEDEAVQMLLAISSIVSNEMKRNAFIFDEDEDESSKGGGSRVLPSGPANWLLTPPLTSQSPVPNDEERFQWSRVRSVSIDSPTHFSLLASPKYVPNTTFSLGRPALISPTSTPIGRGRPVRRASLKLAQKAKREQLKMPKVPHIPTLTTAVKDHKKKALAASLAKGTKLKTIGRKKFSWKNYPELEGFLVANREEYLRHSALNYTVQQKQYNNRLTEQLLELAAEHGYVFDDIEFSFVTVRDRIRCYFKSYVQSAKKRGVTVGYAARKAGLLTEDDLRVEQEGQIIVPETL